MEIKINDNEKFILAIPEQVGLPEVNSIIERLTKVVKVFSKDFPMMPEPQNIGYVKSNRVKLKYRHNIAPKDKGEAVKILTDFYSTKKTGERAKIFNKNHTCTPVYVHTNLKDWISQYAITPEEVGLLKWYGKGEGQKDFRLSAINGGNNGM